MFTFGFFRDCVFFIVGLFWCRAVFRRLRRDIEALDERREIRVWAAIAALWGVTAVVLICLIGSTVGVVRSIAHS